MTAHLVTVTPERSVEECMAIMTQRRVRHLPVMVGDDLLGLLSIGDVVKAVISEKQDHIEQLETYITRG
jgi:CBS domain-containing protein